MPRPHYPLTQSHPPCPPRAPPPKWLEWSGRGLPHNSLFWGTAAYITASLPNVTFDLWIGLHASQRDFQWVEQEPLLYANWAPGEPSGPSPAPSGNIPVRPSPLSPLSPPPPRPAAPRTPSSNIFAWSTAFGGQRHQAGQLLGLP